MNECSLAGHRQMLNPCVHYAHLTCFWAARTGAAAALRCRSCRPGCGTGRNADSWVAAAWPPNRAAGAASLRHRANAQAVIIVVCKLRRWRVREVAGSLLLARSAEQLLANCKAWWARLHGVSADEDAVSTAAFMQRRHAASDLLPPLSKCNLRHCSCNKFIDLAVRLNS